MGVYVIMLMLVLFSTYFNMFYTFLILNSNCIFDGDMNEYICHGPGIIPKPNIYKDKIRVTKFYMTNYYPTWNNKDFLNYLQLTIINSSLLPCNNITRGRGDFRLLIQRKLR